MVGMMFVSSREEAASHLNSFKCAMDIPSKLEYLRRLKEVLLHKDPSLLPDFVHRLVELQADRFSPIRKALAEFFGAIGLVCVDFVPEIVPILISWLNDDTPAVARQAIASGTHLFRGILEKVAVQGLHSSDLDESLRSSWGWMLKFKDILCPIAFQPGRDGIRLPAVKFVEAMVLLYSPDPSASSESPDLHACNGRIEGFNISWVKGGHPLLKLGDLSIEAGQILDSLLDLLRFPKVKSLSNSMMIVLINSLSTIAKKRPAFYGRILPVLLVLDPPISVIKGVHFTGVHHVLKSSFLSCLKCTHQGAVPWRDRLLGALKDLKAGNFAEQDVHQDCGSKEDGIGEGYAAKEVNLSIETFDPIEVDTGRKRSAIQQTDDLVENDGAQGKRYRSTLVVSEDSDRNTDPNLGQVGVPLIGSKSSSVDGDTGPVQQLVAMFGALVAQGEKAVGSLEILISSISSDLLAEVVIANMRYLPSSRPGAEEDEERTVDKVSLSSVVGSKILAMQSTSLASEMSALSGVLPQLASLFGAQPLATCGVTLDKQHREDEYSAATIHDTGSVLAGINDVTDAIGSSAVLVTSTDNDGRSILSDSNLGIEESEIPGLDSTMHSDRTVETFDATQMTSSAVSEEKNQELLTSLEQQDFPSSGSLPTDRSEELSPSLAVSDANSVASVTAVVLSSQYVLPKMSAPVVDLTDDQKDELQKTAFIRIIESYKQISVAGGSCLRFSLLAYLAVKYPLELDPWKCLQEHVLSDYSNHEGHELTLRVLYRLFGEAEQEHDFFSSTTATSVYETFLLIVAETLRDSFPASDKSLSRLFNEAPYLPKSAFKLLECLCSPGKSEKADKELQGGDRVTQGLSAVWSLILLRPPIRDVCLKIALQSAVHHMEEVRMKAIRLVANKLYPIPCITQQIEDFASEMLHSVLKSHAMEGTDTDGSTLEVGKVSGLEGPFNAQALSLTTQKEVSSDNHLPSSAPATSSSLTSESQRCMSLYFALCTKKHSLFRQIFVIYKSIPKAVIQAVHRHIPILVRTIGSSPELLAIISDPPDGCESLLMQVLHILTEGTIPSPELVSAVRRLYDLKLKDVEILIPVLSSLPKEEVSSIFPKLVNLPLDKFQVALTHVLQGSSHSGPVLTPAEVLIAVNGIDPDKDGIPLKKVTDACNACFEQRHLFTQQVLAKVLNQLVEQTPLPLLFMRTVLQAIGAFPALVDFIMEILSRLVTKQIWRYPKLWVGFLKCTLLTKPQSFSVLLQLPAAQLENALNRNPALKAPLAAHANQPNIRSSLPRSSLVVLGIATESHISSQSQTSAALVDTTNSASNGATETAKESSTAS